MTNAVGFALSLKRLDKKGSDIREERANQILVDYVIPDINRDVKTHREKPSYWL